MRAWMNPRASTSHPSRFGRRMRDAGIGRDHRLAPPGVRRLAEHGYGVFGRCSGTAISDGTGAVTTWTLAPRRAGAARRLGLSGLNASLQGCWTSASPSPDRPWSSQGGRIGGQNRGQDRAAPGCRGRHRRRPEKCRGWSRSSLDAAIDYKAGDRAPSDGERPDGLSMCSSDNRRRRGSRPGADTVARGATGRHTAAPMSQYNATRAAARPAQLKAKLTRGLERR